MTPREALQKAMKIYGTRKLARALDMPRSTLWSRANRKRIDESTNIFTKNDTLKALCVQHLTNNKVKAKQLCPKLPLLNINSPEIRKELEETVKRNIDKCPHCAHNGNHKKNKNKKKKNALVS